MTAWTTQMRMIVINAMTENVMMKQSLHVKRIRSGIELNVFQGSGCAMVIQIVLVSW